MSVELLLKQRQVREVELGNGNSQGDQYGRGSTCGLKGQRDAWEWIGRRGGSEQVLAGENPGGVCAVAEQAFVAEPGLGRGGQKAPIAAVKVGSLKPPSHQHQHNQRARQLSLIDI